ncbi:MAG TPA: FkbM family methyltransferase [Burkholderiales bacterium]|jgi:FkbM family methyltransferase|nr:FkbM family methyltransferase [Burkholderiales bacterium]
MFVKKIIKAFPTLTARAIGTLVKTCDRISGRLWSFHGRAYSQAILQELHHQVASQPMAGERANIKYLAPTNLTLFRANTVFSKEPETISWIDSFADGEVFWDIGANVGTYSVYALCRHDRLQVVAIEPSPLNLELLIRNVNENAIAAGRFTLVPLALTSKLGHSVFNLSSMELGGALNAFGVDYGHDGKRLEGCLSYSTVGVSIDDLIETFKLSPPNHIKIDVDGIEHLVLQGATSTLKNMAVKSILIELNESFQEQYQACTHILQAAGFKESHRAAADKLSGSESATCNIIFVRQ